MADTITTVTNVQRAIALARGVYNLRLVALAGWETTISVTSKVIAVILPSLLVGLSFVKPIMRNVNAFLVLNTILILGSFALGGLLVSIDW
jgi:hypothetical protein